MVKRQFAQSKTADAREFNAKLLASSTPGGKRHVRSYEQQRSRFLVAAHALRPNNRNRGACWGA
jgi:hypothetical protein